MPHRDQPLHTSGVPLPQARAAAILLHGRGGTAADILTLGRSLTTPHVAFLAPQAAENTWYPYSFRSPLSFNEPDLSSALGVVDALVAQVSQAGLPPERLMLLGFSQGACLALEYAARHAHRFGAVVGFSGALIGPDNTPRGDTGSLAGTPVFLGCSDADPHIPALRVTETAAVLTSLGGHVTLEFYENLGHTINADELRRARALLSALAGGEAAHE